ncbi:MAG: glutathione S-transferase family protein [Dongiaceae bacterium]
MYTLYWSAGSASVAPHLVLAEIGGKAAFKRIDMAKNEHKSAKYLKINPHGRLPALADGRKILLESAGICMYLADRHPKAKLAPKPNDPARGAFNQWMLYLSNTLQPAYLRYYYPDRITGEATGTAGVQAKAKEELDAIYRHIDKHLAKRGPFLLGRQPSAADYYLLMLSCWQDPVPELYKRFPKVKRLADALRKRPAVRKVLAENGLA